MRASVRDEARSGTRGTITRVRAGTGSRPRAVRQDGPARLDVLLAVGASTGAASARIMPGLNAAAVNLSPVQIARGLPAAVHAVLLRDGAGVPTEGDLVVPGEVSLIRPPPYSPEWNSVEEQWHDLRSHHESDRA
ncbi:MAG: hypothetical protein JO034_24780 [Singulisphaera sp.]|nr:hypothetical protein [Singulisphaera sp.]